MKLRHNPCKNVVRAANNFKPWDYGFMLDLEQEALRCFFKYFEENRIVADAHIVARDCRLMHSLLKIALDEEPETEPPMDNYVNIRNAHRFLKDFGDCAIMRKSLREQKAWYLYNKLRYYRLQNCWD